MRIKSLTLLTLALCLALVLSIGCATTAVDEKSAQAEAPADWKFHSIVDVNFVMEHVTVPMAEDVVIIDARPKRHLLQQLLKLPGILGREGWGVLTRLLTTLDARPKLHLLQKLL